MPPKLSPVTESIYSYKIIVEGTVDASMSVLLNGLEICHTSREDASISIITGQLPDQSALSGILDVLIDHRYALLSVKRIDPS